MGILRRGAVKSVVSYRMTLGLYDHLIKCTKDLDDIKILDFGGEASTVSHVLKDKNTTLHVVNLPDVCKAGKTQYEEIKYFEDLRLIDTTYDIITSYCSIMYADSLEEALEIFQACSPKYIVFGNVITTEENTYMTEQGKTPYRIYNMKDMVENLPNFELVEQKEHSINYQRLKSKLALDEDTPLKCLNFYFRNKKI